MQYLVVNIFKKIGKRLVFNGKRQVECGELGKVNNEK
jgi:hypothetical protein